MSASELILLTLFQIEILTNLYAYGLNYYHRDKIMILDTMAIYFSIITLIWSFINDVYSLEILGQMVMGAFRITRLFLTYQKI